MNIILNVCDFYNFSQGTDDLLKELNVGEPRNLSGSLVTLIWLGSLLSLPVNELRKIVERRDQSISIAYSIKCQKEPQNVATTRGLTPSNRSVIRQESRDELADRIQNIESLLQRSSPPPNNPVQPDLGDFDCTRSANRRQSTSNVNSNDQAKREDCQYSSIGAIAQLSRDRTRDDAPQANIGGLNKYFTHPTSKFSGEGDLAENLGAYHQSFMNICRSSNLTEKGAFANLYILFPSSSQADRFYRKHVLTKARSLDEAFKMLYSRLMSNERRYRLLYQWNNLRFSDFMKKSGNNKQSASRELCSTTSSIQL